MKCPYCGHPDRIHAGPRAKTAVPGTCLCGPKEKPCDCPGWEHWTVSGRERHLELQMEQERVERHFGKSAFTLWEEDG